MYITADIPSRLLEDEVIKYLADRYHLTPAGLLEVYRQRSVNPAGEDDNSDSLLKDNEILLIGALERMYAAD